MTKMESLNTSIDPLPEPVHGVEIRRTSFNPTNRDTITGHTRRVSNASASSVASRRRSQSGSIREQSISSHAINVLRHYIQPMPEQSFELQRSNGGDVSMFPSPHHVSNSSSVGSHNTTPPFMSDFHFSPRQAKSKYRHAGISADASFSNRESRSSSFISQSIPSKETSSTSQGPYPQGENLNASLIEIKNDVMVTWLSSKQVERRWSQGGLGEGVVLKKTRATYTCHPEILMNQRDGLFDAIQRLNVRCAMTVNTPFIKLFLRSQSMDSIPISDSLKIQIIPSIADLPQCRKHHFAAFVQDTAMLVVWDDDPKHILDRVRRLEQQLLAVVWRGDSMLEEDMESSKEQNSHMVFEGGVDGFREALIDRPRKAVLIQAILTGITMTMLMAAIGAGFQRVTVELLTDKSWTRLALIAAVPIQIWLALFFMQSIPGCLAQMLGPISQMKSNSKFYSGLPPPRINHEPFPHVTIQCPVYKESLQSVIDPTVKSIKAAISTYEMQGGSANLFINDDGMQVVPEADAQARKDYYEEHNIGWVARPKHCPKPTDDSSPFVRAGKFKKASNMNYALAVSVRIEDKLRSMGRASTSSQDNEKEAYDEILREVIDEDQGRTWAEGNLRIGDYILLIDSDTRVPEDCLMDAVSEMENSPQVAVLQQSSGVMNVTDSFFERGITFFTNLVYTAIQYAVANGDVAPFVGHNAILKWSAIQDIAYTGEDGTEKYWSESTVSEDFDMALRLQCEGYLIRLGAYSHQGFKEGVSLTVYDELARWEKYAYGCSELIFHPLKDWPFKGPFTPLFRFFLKSSMLLPSKITILSYVGTYYAISSAFPLTLLNYFLIGWFNGHYDHYYLDSFKIYVAIVVIFNILGNVALAVLRYRADGQSLFSSLQENFRWVLLLTIFLGGLSLHLSQAILSHLLSIDMSWGATAKEATQTSFFEEIPKVLKNFRWTFVICFATVGVMVVLGLGIGVPQGEGWDIRTFTAIWPLATLLAAHVLLPIVLNPGLMLFTW